MLQGGSIQLVSAHGAFNGYANKSIHKLFFTRIHTYFITIHIISRFILTNYTYFIMLCNINLVFNLN